VIRRLVNERGALALFLVPIALLASTLVRAADPKPVEVPDTLEQRLLACAACHGKQGEGTSKNEVYPRLAGKPDG